MSMTIKHDDGSKQTVEYINIPIPTEMEMLRQWLEDQYQLVKFSTVEEANTYQKVIEYIDDNFLKTEE